MVSVDTRNTKSKRIWVSMNDSYSHKLKHETVLYEYTMDNLVVEPRQKNRLNSGSINCIS